MAKKELNTYFVEILYASKAGNPLYRNREIKAESPEAAIEIGAKRVERQKNWLKTNGGSVLLITKK